MQGNMAPVDVARCAIEERAQQKRGRETTKFESGRRDNHNGDDDGSSQPVFSTVDITPVSTIVLVTSTRATLPVSSITSFTTLETDSATTEPSSTVIAPLLSTTISPVATAIPTTTQVPTASSFSISITSSSLATSATAFLETASPSAASQSLLSGPSFHHHDSLSPTAEHLLIVAGTLGFVIIAAFGVWCVLRVHKNGGFKFLFRLKAPETYPPPSYYPQTESFPAEKAPPRKLSAFYNPIPAPPPTTAELALANTQRQELVCSALIDNPAPMGLSPAPPPKSYTPLTCSATEDFYAPQLVPTNDDDFRANMYRASELSSLSSGFGDAKIDVPESGPSTLEAACKSLAYRTSKPMFNHFSWGEETAPSPIDSRNRDTIYTQASEAPRFRSIYSWVSQQTTRVERQLSKAKNIGERKEMGVGHRRLDSEDPTLRIHPWQEVELERGTRVASSIFDTKVTP